MTREPRIGAGDLLLISRRDLFDPAVVDFRRKARVDRAGHVSLPIVGDVAAAGLTTSELATAIPEAYNRAGLDPFGTFDVRIVERGMAP